MPEGAVMTGLDSAETRAAYRSAFQELMDTMPGAEAWFAVETYERSGDLSTEMVELMCVMRVLDDEDAAQEVLSRQGYRLGASGMLPAGCEGFPCPGRSPLRSFPFWHPEPCRGGWRLVYPHEW